MAVLRNGSWAELSYENVETMATELGDLVRTALRRLTEVSNTTSDSHSPLVDNVVFIANSFKTIVWSQLTPYVMPIMSSVVNTVMSTVAQAILFFSTFVFLVRSRRRVSPLPPSATADANRERAAGRVCATRLQITSERTVVRHAVNIIIGPRHLDLCDIAEKMLTQVRTTTRAWAGFEPGWGLKEAGAGAGLAQGRLRCGAARRGAARGGARPAGLRALSCRAEHARLLRLKPSARWHGSAGSCPGSACLCTARALALPKPVPYLCPCPLRCPCPSA